MEPIDASLVSVICTCYNHEEYIQDALDSVVAQSHPHLELIIIDNGSRDDSASAIQGWVDHHEGFIPVHTIFRPSTVNYCQSFNQALSMVKGNYVIDLSGDDVLLPDHVATALETLEDRTNCIYFSNALLEEEGKPTSVFYPVGEDTMPLKPVASGDIYQQVIHNTVVCAATLVFPKATLVEEGGYDENLSYEDFDILVRLARKHHFTFNPHIGVKKRILNSSFSSQQYRRRNSVMLPSTLKVCHKILRMNRTAQENEALLSRLMFEAKHALASANFEVAQGFLNLAGQMGGSGWHYSLFAIWARVRWDLSFFYEQYVRLKSRLRLPRGYFPF